MANEATPRSWVRQALRGAGVGAACYVALLIITSPPNVPVVYCGHCAGIRRAVPLVYGLPGFELIEASHRGEVVLGGCVVRGVEAARVCRTCREPILGLAAFQEALLPFGRP